MISETDIRESLRRSLDWFRNSGIMLPSDGSWGVGERIAVTRGNEAIDEMREAFPALLEHDGWAVLEQRRADCNFQLAWLFLQSSKLPGAPEEYRRIGENLLDFLYFRSGLLKKTGSTNGYYFPCGSWQWSHITHFPKIYFDDEAWCVFIQLEIAENFPELEAKYSMRHWALTLADELCNAAERVLASREKDENGNWRAPDGWDGRFNLPHWGGLACMALARAAWKNADAGRSERYSRVIADYFEYAEGLAGDFICSELAYLLLACSAVVSYLNTEQSRRLQQKVVGRLLSSMDDRGNLPAQHNEAPIGNYLVDLIYTENWAFLALQTVRLTSPEIDEAFQRVFKLILDIQDTANEQQFNGCWRGMYDLSCNAWGGGDRYEGGASSIYSGWTNAPIAITLVQALLNRHLFSH